MQTTFNRFLVLVVVAVLLSLTAGIVSGASVTQSITYQGKLTDAGGTPLTGTYPVTFSLYDVPSGGTALVQNHQTITCTNGLFTTPAMFVPEMFNGQALWLGVAVGSDPEMTPRQEIRPVPYALSLRPGALIAQPLASPALSLVKTGAGKALSISTTADGSEGIFVRATGKESKGYSVIAEGEGSRGINATSYGRDSKAVWAYAPDDLSTAIEVSASGEHGKGVSVHTTGEQDAGIFIQTSGDNSHGSWSEIFRKNSIGSYIHTYEDSSEGVKVLTNGEQSDGIYVTTLGGHSTGVNVTTKHEGSAAIRAKTEADNAYGIRTETSGTGSHGIWSVTNNDDSAALVAVTKGEGSDAISATTHERDSTGLYAKTRADHSDAIRATTEGPVSAGVNITTKNDYSPGVTVSTEGENSYGVEVYTRESGSIGFFADTEADSSTAVYAHGRGEHSHGVYASSDRSDAIYADTGNPDSSYGVYTPDKMSARTYDTNSGDVAEYIPVAEDAEPGTVLVIGPDGKLVPSTTAYDTRVAGIVSTQPGLALATKEGGNPGEAAVALAGRVPCRVDAGYGAIHPGDVLTTSATPGHAMKAVPVNAGGVEIYRPGTVLGKALGTLESGTGTIEVLVTLQ